VVVNDLGGSTTGEDGSSRPQRDIVCHRRRQCRIGMLTISKGFVPRQVRWWPPRGR
jgi:hypothetical protein